MSEKLTAKQAAEQLLYKPEYAADKSADVKEKAAAFAEGYKAFLNAAKTEREAAAASEKLRRRRCAFRQLMPPAKSCCWRPVTKSLSRKRPMPPARRSTLCRSTRRWWPLPSAGNLLRRASVW